jgi:Tol biopolymer transport system component
MAIVSPNGQYMAKMQYDGNFVVYNGNQETGTPIWVSSTNGYYLAYLMFQIDGNVVVYSSGGGAVWGSNVYGSYTPSLLNLQM